MNEIANAHPVKQVIVVDDDQATLFMCKVIIQRTFKDILVCTYINPQLAVDYFENEFSLNPVKSVILLDINMPEVSGWDVLASLDQLDSAIKKKISVIMHSSSIDPKDKEHAIEFPFVSGYIEKPLKIVSLEEEMNKILAEMACN